MLVSAIGQEKEIKDIHIGKKDKRKMTVHKENPKNLPKKLLEQIK